MTQRHSVSGRRSAFIWLSALIGLMLVAALAVIVLFVYPNYQRRQQVKQHYQAGVAFQEMEDWDKALEAFEETVAMDATHNDARSRLAEVKAKQQEAQAAAQAEATRAAVTAQARAEATTRATTTEAGIARATVVAATTTEQAKATVQAQEAMATRTAEALDQRRQQMEQHYQAGVAFQEVEDWDKAMEAFEKVIALDAGYKDTQARLAEVRAKQREATATAHAVAVTATADAVETHYQKGLAYMNLAQWDEAKAELEQVFAVDPNYKEIQSELREIANQLAQITPTPSPFVVTFDVPAKPRWASTGVELKRGDSVTIEYIEGQWQAGSGYPLVGPEGDPRHPSKPAYTLPDSRLMSLIARVGEGPPFLIDRGKEFRATSSNMLWLGANDDQHEDNSGSVTVRVTVQEP